MAVAGPRNTPIDAHAHDLWPLDDDASRQHRTCLRGRAHAEGNGAEGAERTRVAIAATECHAGAHESTLGNEHMADAVIADVVELDTVTLCPPAKMARLLGGGGIVCGRNVVVYRDDRAWIVENVAKVSFDLYRTGRRRDLVRDDLVDKEQIVTVLQ